MDRISAFMDGESGRRETSQAIEHLKQQREFRESWDTYHLIGDAMRGDSLPGHEFTRRLRERLDAEPVVRASRLRLWRRANLAISAAVVSAAVAVVFTLALDDSFRPAGTVVTSPPPTVARSQQVPQDEVRAHPVPASRQGPVNEYLMAHQEFSPITAWHGVAPYVRTVSSAYHGDNQ